MENAASLILCKEIESLKENFPFLKTGSISSLFDHLIEDTDWFAKRKILDKLNRSKTHNKIEACNNFYLYKLIDLISASSDFHLQVVTVEFIIKFFKLHNALIRELFPESKNLQEKFKKIIENNGNGNVREFLNSVNRRTQNVFSIKYQSITYGSIKCVNVNKNLWMDFNLVDKIVSWYIDVEKLSKESKKHNYCLIYFDEVTVHSVTVRRNLCKTITIEFKMKKPCLSYYEKYQSIINNIITLDVLLDYSTDAEHLIHSILPSIYKEKINIIRKKSYNCKSILTKRSNSTSIDECTTYDSNEKSSSESSSVKSSDTEEYLVHFQSQDQLLKTAQKFDCMRNAMNKYFTDSVRQLENDTDKNSDILTNDTGDHFSGTLLSEIISNNYLEPQISDTRTKLSTVHDLNDNSIGSSSIIYKRTIRSFSQNKPIEERDICTNNLEIDQDISLTTNNSSHINQGVQNTGCQKATEDNLSSEKISNRKFQKRIRSLSESSVSTNGTNQTRPKVKILRKPNANKFRKEHSYGRTNIRKLDKWEKKKKLNYEIINKITGQKRDSGGLFSNVLQEFRRDLNEGKTLEEFCDMI